jgi:hypothetical protein
MGLIMYPSSLPDDIPCFGGMTQSFGMTFDSFGLENSSWGLDENEDDDGERFDSSHVDHQDYRVQHE